MLEDDAVASVKMPEDGVRQIKDPLSYYELML